MIGKAVAESLGIAYYDKELIALIAKKSGFSPEFIAQNSEYRASSPLDYLPVAQSGFVAGGLDGALLTPTDRVQVELQNIIQALAEKGPCLIVGRGADYILRHRTDVLNVFLYASESQRIANIVARTENCTNEEALNQLKEKDKQRRRNYKHYTDQTWGSPELYHICLNTGALGTAQSISIIAGVYKNQQAGTP